MHIACFGKLLLWFSSATSREFGEGLLINFHLSAANFQMNLVVGSTFQTDEIDCELMNENIARACHKYRLVELAVALEMESLSVRN
jgi:hypothetical protein